MTASLWKRVKAAAFILVGHEPIPKKANYSFFHSVKVESPNWVEIGITLELDYLGDTYVKKVYQNAVNEKNETGKLSVSGITTTLCPN